MIKTIPGRIENGCVIPDAPLPPADTVRNVSIVLELAADTPVAPPHPDQPGLLKWAGILKDYAGDPKADYRKHLEEKYL